MGEPSDLRAGSFYILTSEALTESRSNVKSFPIVTCLAVPALAPTAPVALSDRDQG
jgi:hypothetical protein